jgi:anti-anti-sigma factor
MSEPTRLDVRVEQADERVTVIAAEGELDLASADLLRDALLGQLEKTTVVLELGKIEFCDSTGLRVLVEAHRVAGAHGTALRLAAPSPAIERVLELTGANAVLHTYPGRDAALNA